MLSLYYMDDKSVEVSRQAKILEFSQDGKLLPDPTIIVEKYRDNLKQEEILMNFMGEYIFVQVGAPPE